jgi:hypothetical protein
VGGSDRIELLWADSVAANIKKWMEIVVKGNDTLGGSNTNTGLAASYVFMYGNAIGDDGVANSGGFVVNSADEIGARNDPHGLGNPALITNVHDYDRNKQVTSADQIIARNNPTSSIAGTALKFINIGAGGPFVPEVGDGTVVREGGGAGVASALASGSQLTTTAPLSALSTPANERPAATPALVQIYFCALAQPESLNPDELVHSATAGDVVDDELLDLLTG